MSEKWRNETKFQDKTKFVLDILEYSIRKKVDNATNERLINLIEKEIDESGTFGKEITERIQKIEEVLGLKQTKANSEKIGFKPKSPKPNETKSFLALFNNSDGLKYLTHKFNDGKREYETFIKLCREEFDNGKKNYPNVPDALLKRIEEFAFAQDPEWYIRKGNEKFLPKKGWSEPIFVDWYKKAGNLHPGQDAKWNNEMIIPFKESIEVRAGNLSKIIDESMSLAFADAIHNFTIKYNPEQLNIAEFYTDVDMFKQALFHIFSTIKDRADKNSRFKINVEFINETLDGGKFKKIVISHLNSEASKNSNDPDFAKGDLKTIQLNLYGLCNYEILSKFPDGFRKIIILTDDENEYRNYLLTRKSIPIEKTSLIEGFTHVLKFY